MSIKTQPEDHNFEIRERILFSQTKDQTQPEDHNHEFRRRRLSSFARDHPLEFINSSGRIKLCELLNKEDINNEGLLYERLTKQYEIIGVVSALITATLGMVLDNTNVHDGYKTTYDLINGIGIIFSLTCVVDCLILTALLSIIEKKEVLGFVKHGAIFLSKPLICIMVGILCMYICVTMYFGGFKVLVLFPCTLILFTLSFIFYIRQRCYVLDRLNKEEILL